MFSLYGSCSIVAVNVSLIELFTSTKLIDTLLPIVIVLLLNDKCDISIDGVCGVYVKFPSVNSE